MFSACHSISPTAGVRRQGHRRAHSVHGGDPGRGAAARGVPGVAKADDVRDHRARVLRRGEARGARPLGMPSAAIIMLPCVLASCER